MRKFFNLILVLFVLSAGFGFMFWFFYTLYSVFQGASDNIKAASITAIVTVFTLILGRFLEGRRETQNRINLERIKIYSEYFDFYFVMLTPPNLRPEQDELEIAKKIREFNKKFLLWASDEVLKAQDDFNQCLADFGAKLQGSRERNEIEPSLADPIKASANLLRQMRRDVGYRYTKVTDQQFARMLLKLNDEGAVELIKGL